MSYCNRNYAGAATCAPTDQGSCVSGFSCVINLIIIFIVLQFLSQIICDLQCD